MQKIPDKLTYKATITNRLRNDIVQIIENNNLKNYLEVGCCVGYTMISIANESKSLNCMTGLDIDPNRIKDAKINLDKFNCKNYKLVTGTIDSIDESNYDVVLIDAAHDYNNVKHDFNKTIEKSTSEIIHVVFHDYGLNGAGVKKFVNELNIEFKLIGEDSNYNPLGSPVSDWEAAYVVINRLK